MSKVNELLDRVMRLERDLASANERAEEAEALIGSVADERDEAIAEAESLRKVVDAVPAETHREPIAEPEREYGKDSAVVYERRMALR